MPLAPLDLPAEMTEMRLAFLRAELAGPRGMAAEVRRAWTEEADYLAQFLQWRAALAASALEEEQTEVAT